MEFLGEMEWDETEPMKTLSLEWGKRSIFIACTNSPGTRIITIAIANTLEYELTQTKLADIVALYEQGEEDIYVNANLPRDDPLYPDLQNRGYSGQGQAYYYPREKGIEETALDLLKDLVDYLEVGDE